MEEMLEDRIVIDVFNSRHTGLSSCSYEIWELDDCSQYEVKIKNGYPCDLNKDGTYNVKKLK
jgi:hypothetical protein